MRQKELLTKILNIRREEFKPVFLLMSFSFFIGLSLSFYFTASNAIFLKHFSPQMIPVSFIASGVIVCLAWWIFSQIDKKISFSSQVTVKFLFVFISVLAISIGVWAFDTNWLAFIMYTWVRVMVYITLVNFWGVAGKLFNIRQGKRIFGLISIGEVISIIIGYFSIPLILQFLKAPDLLFMASASLFICLVMVFIIFKKFKEQLETEKKPDKPDKVRIKSEWNYWNLLKKPYFLMISLMALLPIFGYLFVDFLFLAQTKREFANNPETIARFFGIFLGFVAIVELLFKLFSGRFLNKYGLKPSLLSLPFVLLFSIFLAAVFGTIYGTVGLFFAFIAFSRLFERSMRGAVYEPAFQLLYQPLPAEQRLPFQNQIEGIPKALGTVITGAVILLLSSIPHLSLVYFNYFFLLVLGFWIFIAFKMYDEYRNMLKSILSGLKETSRNERDPMVTFLENSLSSCPPDRFNPLFEVIEKVEPAFFEKVMEGAFNAAPIQIKRAILTKIHEKQFVPAMAFIKQFLEQNREHELKELLEYTYYTLKEAEEYSFDQLVEMSGSEMATTRARVARLLGYSGRYNTYKILINLLKDHDPLVIKEALISAGKIRRYELWPLIIEKLTSPEYINSAAVAIKIIGEPILNELDHHFEKTIHYKPAQVRIIRILESIGGKHAIKALRNKIAYPEKDIRNQVLLSLSNLEYRASVSELAYIKQTIEESVETMVWIMASLIDIGGSIKTLNLQNALISEMEEKKEDIFLLLSLLYDAKTIKHIREHIESPDNKAKIYALEICDMTVSEEIKEIFLPMFEDLSLPERLHRFSEKFPQEKMPVIERLNDIILKDYLRISKWTKACAIDLLGDPEIAIPGITEKLLAANIVNPDRMLCEIAGWKLLNLNPGYFSETLSRFEKRNLFLFPEVIQTIQSRKNNTELLLFEKILVLKCTDLFAPIPEMEIANLVLNMYDRAGNEVTGQGTKINKMEDVFVVKSGDSLEFCIPMENLFETMAGNRKLTERYILQIENHHV